MRFRMQARPFATWAMALTITAGGAGVAAGTAQPAAAAGYVGALPFAYVPGEITARTDVVTLARQLAHSPAAGISWKFKWADVQPAPGLIDWTPVDNAVAAARSVHLPVILRVIAGMYSPGWVLAKSQVVRIPNSAFPNPAPYPNPTVIPVAWNPSYLTAWTSFVHSFGARYDGMAGVSLVEMTGGGVVGDMYLPADPSAWQQVGYTDAKLIGAWQQIISSYGQAFHRSPLSLAFAKPFGCTPGKALCRPGSTNVMQPVVSLVEQTLRSRAWLQDNGLKPAYLGRIGPNRKIIEAAHAFTGTGYQMAGAMGGGSGLRSSFTVARQDQVNFVEVYSTDLLNPAAAADLRYLRYG